MPNWTGKDLSMKMGEIPRVIDKKLSVNNNLGSAFSKAIINMQVACETGLNGVQELTEKTGLSMRDLQLMAENNGTDFKKLAQSLGYTQSEMKSMLKAGDNLKNFADVAGMTSEQFQQMFQNDSSEAITAFINGLGDVEGKGESTIQMLQDMGFTEVRLRDTLTRLASSGDLVSEALETGTGAWKDNTALTKEAEQRYKTFESQVKILRNRFVEVGIQLYEILHPILIKVIDKVGKGVEAFSKLSEEQKTGIVKFAGFIAMLGPFVSVFGKVTGIVGRTTKGVGTFFGALKKAGSLKALILSPVGKIVLILIALVAVGALVYKNWDKIKAIGKKSWGYIKEILGNCGITSDKVKEKFVTLKDKFVGAWDKMKEGASRFWDYISPFFLKVSGLFVAVFPHALAGALSAFSTWFSGIFDIIGLVLDAFGGLVDFISNAFCGNWKEAFKGLKTFFENIMKAIVEAIKLPINTMISLVNGAITSMNKLGITIPSWVPEIGGKSFGFNLPTIPMLANGTDNWKGGLAQINEPWIGGEIVDLPSGTRVYPHDESIQKARADGARSASTSKSIVVKKLADSIVVREEADIDTIVEKLVKKLERVTSNTSNEVYA